LETTEMTPFAPRASIGSRARRLRTARRRSWGHLQDVADLREVPGGFLHPTMFFTSERRATVSAVMLTPVRDGTL